MILNKLSSLIIVLLFVAACSENSQSYDIPPQPDDEPSVGDTSGAVAAKNVVINTKFPKFVIDKPVKNLDILKKFKPISLIVEVREKIPTLCDLNDDECDQNKPIEWAKISIFDSDEKKVGENFTNKYGTRSFYIKNGNKYKIIVNKEGYGAQTTEVFFEKGLSSQIVKVDLETDLWKSVDKTTVNIKSHDYATDELKTAVYDSYQLPDTDFRVVCQQPCPIPQNLLKRKTAGIYNAIERMLELTEMDVLETNKPVNIHLTDDLECNLMEMLENVGFVTGSAGGDQYGDGSKICTYEWDKENTSLPLNPKYASALGLDVEVVALRLDAQLLVIHEYVHILFYDRTFGSPEDFSRAISLYVSGFEEVIDYNPVYKVQSLLIPDACDMHYHDWAVTVYDLCTKCGFNFDDMPALFQKIDSLYKSGKGEEIEGKVSTPQLKDIFDDITGKDSVKDCGVPWLADKGNL